MKKRVKFKSLFVSVCPKCKRELNSKYAAKTHKCKPKGSLGVALEEAGLTSICKHCELPKQICACVEARAYDKANQLC